MHHRIAGRRARALRALALATLGLAGLATGRAEVPASGATYDASQPRIERVAIYVFLDMRPEYLPDAFRRTLEARLAKEFTRSGVATRQVWLGDTQAGKDLVANMAARTAANLTAIPMREALVENIDKDREFRPDHWLFVYPTRTTRSGQMTERWEFKNTTTGYIDWSIYSTSEGMTRDMDPAQAEKAAVEFADSMVAELRRCKVIAEPARDK